jgi:hypothetical protein
MGAKYAIKSASSLAVGDVVKVWWSRGGVTVSGFRSNPRGEPWRVADFSDGVSMTIAPFMLLPVLEK